MPNYRRAFVPGIEGQCRRGFFCALGRADYAFGSNPPYALDTNRDDGSFAPSFEWRNPRPQLAALTR